MTCHQTHTLLLPTMFNGNLNESILTKQQKKKKISETKTEQLNYFSVSLSLSLPTIRPQLGQSQCNCPLPLLKKKTVTNFYLAVVVFLYNAVTCLVFGGVFQLKFS